ncbi:MAG: hypothetical protein IKR69_07340, partial [Bacteroidales bacterium]|nr:hypothetical protein [Bacteroidales bacterium]
MKKVIISILLVLGTQLLCNADTWSDMLRAYKMDLSTLVRGNGYQIFRSEAGGLGIAYSEMDAAGQCHFSLAMVPVEALGLRWLPGAGADYMEIQDYGYTSGVMALQEVEGPETDPKLGSFGYVIEPIIFVGPDGRILNLGYYGDKLIFLIQRDSGVFWLGEDGKKVDIPAVNPPASPAAPTLHIADTRVVDLGLSVFWADRNVGADAPQAYGDYVPFGFEVPWGGGWRTPSYKEMEELVLKCSWELTACDGVKGYKVIGPNGNAIFLPFGGAVFSDGELASDGESGAIWSSERHSEKYYLENNYIIFLQMTQSTTEKYRHYIRSYNL